MASCKGDKKDLKPRLEFTEEDEERDTNTADQSLTDTTSTIGYSSLLSADEHWTDHENMAASHVHEARHNEAKERPSVTSTAGRGVFARFHKTNTTATPANRDTGSFTFKVIFLGDASVGKTCLAKLYIDRKVVLTNTQATIAFDCKTKELVIDGVPSTLQLWDTAGMEQFRRGLVNQYYRNLDGAIFVYDITSRESFVNIEEWFSEMRQFSRSEEGRIKTLLLGNKCDLEDKRQVTIEEGQAYAHAHNMLFTEISAKNNDCLHTLDSFIERLSERMLIAREENSLTRSMHDVIRLEGHLDADWVIVDEVPQGPFSNNDNRQRSKSVIIKGQELTNSVRKVFNRGRPRSANMERFRRRRSLRENQCC